MVKALKLKKLFTQLLEIPWSFVRTVFSFAISVLGFLLFLIRNLQGIWIMVAMFQFFIQISNSHEEFTLHKQTNHFFGNICTGGISADEFNCFVHHVCSKLQSTCTLVKSIEKSVYFLDEGFNVRHV